MVEAIDQPPEVKKIFAHHGLVTDELIKPQETIWLPMKSTLRGTPEELLPLLDELAQEGWGRTGRISLNSH